MGLLSAYSAYRNKPDRFTHQSVIKRTNVGTLLFEVYPVLIGLAHNDATPSGYALISTLPMVSPWSQCVLTR